MIGIYRSVVIMSLLIQWGWYFYPWQNFYDQYSISAVGWTGYGALIGQDIAIIYSQILLAVYSVVSLGLLYFNVWARAIFAFLVVFSGISAPLFGLSVTTSFEAMCGYFMTLFDGAILVMVFFTSLANNFSRSAK